MSANTTDGLMPTTGAKRVEAATGEFTGVFRLWADTTHGAVGPLAAPLNCASGEEYLRAVRWRYANSPGVRQQLVIIARRMSGANGEPVQVSGPYAAEAERILSALRSDRLIETVRPTA